MASISLALNRRMVPAQLMRVAAPWRQRMLLLFAPASDTKRGLQGSASVSAAPIDNFDLAYYNAASSVAALGGNLQLQSPYKPINDDADLQGMMNIRPAYAVVVNASSSGRSERYTDVYDGMLRDLYVPEETGRTKWGDLLKKDNQWDAWQKYLDEAMTDPELKHLTTEQLLYKFTKVSHWPARHANGLGDGQPVLAPAQGPANRLAEPQLPVQCLETNQTCCSSPHRL